MMESIALRFAMRRPYSLAQLVDGRILAFDREKRSPVFVMTPRHAPDGDYLPARTGVIGVRRGFVTAVSSNASSTTAVVVPPYKEPNSHSRTRIGQIVDLKDRRLLLIRDQKAFILEVHPAPDGAYLSVGLGVIEVQNGT